MSKGLGKLQRDILARLDSPRTKPWWIDVPPEGVYDLRRVARYVHSDSAGEYAALPFYPDPAFSAAFSRAVRSLIRRGELVEVRHVPLPNGSWSSQTRFVKLP